MEQTPWPRAVLATARWSQLRRGRVCCGGWTLRGHSRCPAAFRHAHARVRWDGGRAVVISASRVLGHNAPSTRTHRPALHSARATCPPRLELPRQASAAGLIDPVASAGACVSGLHACSQQVRRWGDVCANCPDPICMRRAANCPDPSGALSPARCCGCCDGLGGAANPQVRAVISGSKHCDNSPSQGGKKG
jgi:hypothetical protein